MGAFELFKFTEKVRQKKHAESWDPHQTTNPCVSKYALKSFLAIVLASRLSFLDLPKECAKKSTRNAKMQNENEN